MEDKKTTRCDDACKKADAHSLPEGVGYPCVDGEPVKPGDMLWDSDNDRKWTVCEVEFSCARDGTDFYLHLEGPKGETLRAYDTYGLTRTMPVLDRNGVAIEVGDTVYVTGNDRKAHKVTAITNYGQPIVHCEVVKGFPYEYEPQSLTHEPPDSWGRIEADVEKNCCLYFGRGGRACECEDCPVPDVEWDCDTYKVRDIVRRAKALAGVDS
jgi:hypothetical protein